MNRLIIIPLLFLAACAPGSSIRRDQTGSPDNTIGGLSGLMDMAKILEGKLEKGESVNLSISVDAQSVFSGTDYFQPDTDTKSTTEIMAAKDFRRYLGGYNKFSVVDTNALDDISKANYLLTIHVRYSESGQWKGKLISLSDNKTLGEYVCRITDNDQYVQCN